MRVAVQRERGGQLELEQRPLPTPAKGQLLVRMAFAPINPSDLGQLRRTDEDAPALPYVPGNEGSGVVVVQNAGLAGAWLQGRAVAVSPAGVAPGAGTWAEYSLAPAFSVFPLGRKVSLEQGASSLVNPLTALAFIQILKRRRLKAFANNAAASALGQMLHRLAQHENLTGLHIVRRAEQAETLRAAGAAHVLNSSQPDHWEQLAETCQRLDIRLMFDCIAGPDSAKRIAALPHEAALVQYGNLAQTKAELSPSELFLKDRRVEGFYLPNYLRKHGLINTFRLGLRVQRLIPTLLATPIQARYKLSEANEAIEQYLADMSAGKVLLQLGPDE
jgi:NADPH:quinone reductase-like Zn-dependent oxidoreductase